MKLKLLSFGLLSVFALALSCSTKSSSVSVESVVEASNSPRLRHVVMFKFKDSSSTEDIEKVVNAFTQLPTQIPEIKALEWGTNNSPEGLNKGLTHCFLLTFDSESDRDAYLPHPAHKAFGEIAGPHIADVAVLDYYVTD